MILELIIAVAAIGFAALLFGSRRWDSTTLAMRAKLQASRQPIGPKTYSNSELIGLPAPVQRYFQAVLQEGQPMITAAQIALSGTINLSATAEKWTPFTSTQPVITQPPGFDWEGQIQMLPGITARVHDSYIAGEGLLHASLFGLVSLAYLKGTPDIAHGELMRFLAEAAWYPTALLPSQGVQWQAVDSSSANATLKDGATTVLLLFHFTENGLIRSVRSESRGRSVGGTIIPTPWEAHWSHYELHNAMLIPTAGEVAWVFPSGPKPYFRGRLTSIRHELAVAKPI